VNDVSRDRVNAAAVLVAEGAEFFSQPVQFRAPNRLEPIMKRFADGESAHRVFYRKSDAAME
jgi:hypothetical protein